MVEGKKEIIEEAPPGTKCYYNTENCKGELWQCKTCGEWFCLVHWHQTDKGHCVECVACERVRVEVGK